MRDDLNKKFNESIRRPFTELERQLLVAAEKGDAVMVADLIKKGVNALVNSEKPLLLAAENGHLAVVKLLVAEGSLGIMRYTAPTRRAEANGHTEVANYLKQALAAYSRGQWNKFQPKP